MAEAGERERTRDRHAAYFAAGPRREWGRWNGPGWRDAVDWVEVELGNLRSGYRWSADAARWRVATDIVAHAALMGFSVQLFETLCLGRGAARGGGAADVTRLPACTRRPVSRASPDGRTRRVGNAHRATELEVDYRYDACEPGYSMFIEALGQVYCGDLDRYIELTGAVAHTYGRSGATAWPPTSTASSRRAGSRRRSRSPSRRSPRPRSLGNPYWISYALWIAGMAFSKTDLRRAFAAWDAGVAFVREHRVQFFEGFLARDAARLHTSDGEPEAALVLFAEAVAAFHRAGNVPQLIITLASVPALFERLDRFWRRRRCSSARCLVSRSSFHHVPELVDLAIASAASSARGGLVELFQAGAALDLDDAAVYARQQIDAARRDPARAVRETRPGGLSRREIEVLRLVADGRTPARSRTAAVHLVEDGRAPHPEHLHQDRRLEPGLGDPLGRQTQVVDHVADG